MLGMTASLVILTAVLSNTKNVWCLQSSLPTYTARDLHPQLYRPWSPHDVLPQSVVPRTLPRTPSDVLDGISGDRQPPKPSQSQEKTKRNGRELYDKSSKRNKVAANNFKNGAYAAKKSQLVDDVDLTQVLENASKSLSFGEVGVPAQEYYLKELEKTPQQDFLKASKDIFLDRGDLRSWKYKLLKKASDDSSLEADLNGFMKALSNARGVSKDGQLPSNSINVDLKPKISVHSSKEVSSAEARDLALKRWLKSSSAAFSSNEAERRQIEELSYKILSLTNPEEESKDEENDSEIYKAVFTSVAAYQIRKLQRKLRNGRVKRDEEMVCYKELGCFTDDGAFDYLDVLPSPPEEINTKFLLFTRKNPEAAQVFDPKNSTSIERSHFDPASLTKVIIHGFGSSCHRVWVREMRVALLTMVDVNLICVDWENGARVPNYMRAASNTRLVGRQVGRMVEALVKATNTSLDMFHLIGFSLGAHVSGHAGKKLKLKRISGLDPAGPLFENFPPSVRLDASDAEFVDVIHTNADSLIWGGLGAYQAMGHVDFYPNGGRMQKGCANLFVGGVSDILWPTEGDGRSLCNHRRGYKYFVESIAPVCKFPAFVCTDYDAFLRGDCFPCEGCGNMGYYSDKAEGRGQLYLVTRDSEPFCANQYKVSLKHSGGPPLLSAVSTYGRVDVTFIGADGINETIPLTRMPDEELKAGSTTVRILVPHPAITGVKSVQLLYTAYDGWLSSGSKRWAIDKVSIMDSFGTLQSFCKLGVTLESGVPMVLPLQPAECTPRFTPWRPSVSERPEGPISDVASNIRSNATSGITVIEIDNRGPEFNSSVIKTPSTNIEQPSKSQPADGLRPSEVSNTFDGTSSSAHPQSSVIISFPGSSRLPPSVVHSPSSSSASSTFSISLPSSVSSNAGVSGTAYKFVPPINEQDSSHTNLHWSYNYDDFFDVNQPVTRFNTSKYVPTLVVTSRPISDYIGFSSSETVLHVASSNSTHHNVSNLRDGPAPNLYPASMTEGVDESDYSLNLTNADIATTTTVDELLPGVILRPKNFSSSQSRVVIKVNESPAKLWGLSGLQTVPERNNNTSSSDTSAYDVSFNSNSDKAFATKPKNESSLEIKKIPGAHAKTPSIDPKGSVAITSDLKVQKPEFPNLGTRLEYFPLSFDYDHGALGQSSLTLNKPDDDSLLTPYVNIPHGFDDAANPGLQPISYNSLVDGEVPMNERARALFGNSNKGNVQGLTPPNPAIENPVSKVSDPAPLIRNKNSQHPPISLSIGISSDGQTPNFNSDQSEQHYNIKFQRQPNERNESPILSANLRPPAAPTLPQIIRDRQKAEEKLSNEAAQHNIGTTSAPSYLRQLSAYIPQLFSNPLSSSSSDDSDHAPPLHPSPSVNQNNGTSLALPPNISEDSRIRVKGVKLVSRDTDLTTTEKTSSGTSTERSFPYSWSYFFGRRSSEEIEEVIQNDAELSDSSLTDSDNQNRDEISDFRQNHARSSLGDEESHDSHFNGERSSSYVTHELLHHTPAVQQKHVNEPHHFSPVGKPSDVPHVSRYGGTVSPGTAEGLGSPLGGKALNHRRNEPPKGRRRPRHQHRFHLRGGKSGLGPLRHLPKAVKLPKNLPPNYPFYQLNPLTALPTHLVAPPPLKATLEPLQALKDTGNSRDKNSAQEVAESSIIIFKTPSAGSNLTKEYESLSPHSSDSLTSGNLTAHSLSKNKNGEENQDAPIQTDTTVEPATNATNNSTERRMERKLNIDDDLNIEEPSLSDGLKEKNIGPAPLAKVQDSSQPILDIVSYSYSEQSEEPVFGNDNYQIETFSYLLDHSSEAEPILGRDSIRYAMSHVPPSQATSNDAFGKYDYNSESSQWTNTRVLPASLSNTGELVAEITDLSSNPSYPESNDYDTVLENVDDSKKINSPLPTILPVENAAEDYMLADESSVSDEFSFIDSSYASLLPSPALPDPISINPEVIDDEVFFSERFIPGPSLTYKSFLSSPSEMSSAEYRERFAIDENPSNSDTSQLDHDSLVGLTAQYSQDRPADATFVVKDSGFQEENSFGGRSLSVEDDLGEVLRKMSLSTGNFKPSFYPQNFALRNQSFLNERAGSTSSFPASNSNAFPTPSTESPPGQYRDPYTLTETFNIPGVSSSSYGHHIPRMDGRNVRRVYDSTFTSPIYNGAHSGLLPPRRHPPLRWNRELGVKVRRGRGSIPIPIGPIPILGPRMA